LITERARTVAGAALLTAAATLFQLAHGQQNLASAPGAKVVTLSARYGSFTEPSVAINRTNPSQIVAAFQSPAAVAYSWDGGQRWQLATGVSPTDYKISGDVSITYDILGHTILCYIAFDKLGTPQYWAHGATRNGVFVRRSLDGGKTWEPNAVAVDEQPTRPDMPFEDKPYLIADNNPDSPFAGNLYVGWTEFSLSKSIILFERSTDGGITWSMPYEISTHEGIPRDDNGAVEGFDAVAGPDGTLYTVWSDDTSIVMAISRDGGLTFRESRPILSVPASYFKVEEVERSDGFPQIGIDARTEKLYVTWTDTRNGDVDVFCSTSSDRGATWSAPVRVNNDPLHDGADQFFQWLALDPSDGSAYVVFYDRRQDPQNRAALVTLARSTNGGQSFTNYSWTQSPFYTSNMFIGDYTGLAALNGRVYGAWSYAETPANVRRFPVAESRSRDIRFLNRPVPIVVQLGTADFSRAPK
jgi:BNR/Asp-box repeat